MFCHVPFRNVLFPTILTNKGSYSLMFSNVYFQIRSSIILLGAAFERTAEFIYILMSFFMVSKNPLLSILLVTARLCARKSLNFCFLMGCEMIGKMLWHFELFFTVWNCAFVSSNREMAF